MMASPDLMDKIIDQATRLAAHSWEYGTLAQALLEWHTPELSVFGPDPFPDGQVPSVSVDETPSLSYAIKHISTSGDTLVENDGAAGDPASLGVSAILIGQTDQAYLDAAGRQVAHLLDSVPRWSNGAISHRESVAELWADSVYMVPPTLAYHAVASQDVGLLREAIEQCQLYRDVLVVQDGDGAGLLRHIDGPESQDDGLWSTGNAWAAGGMARVYATASKSPYADEVADECAGLADTIKAILDAAIALDDSEPDEPLLRNYLNDQDWFGELSGQTLLAATAYRMVQLAPDTFDQTYFDWAEAKRAAMEERISEGGLLSPVVNSLDWRDSMPASENPEAQSFAILLYAAYKGSQ